MVKWKQVIDIHLKEDEIESFNNYIYKCLKAMYGDHNTPPYNYNFGGTNEDIAYDDVHQEMEGLRSEIELTRIRQNDIINDNLFWMRRADDFKGMADKARAIAMKMMNESPDNSAMSIPQPTTLTKYAAELLDVLDESVVEDIH